MELQRFNADIFAKTPTIGNQRYNRRKTWYVTEILAMPCSLLKTEPGVRPLHSGELQFHRRFEVRIDNKRINAKEY